MRIRFQGICWGEVEFTLSSKDSAPRPENAYSGRLVNVEIRRGRAWSITNLRSLNNNT